MLTPRFKLYTTAVGVLAVLVAAACQPLSPEQEAAQREAARVASEATATSIAVPTVAARQTATAEAVAQASQTAVVVQATSAAITAATQTAREVDARVATSVAATQTAIPTATPVPPTPTPVPPTPTAVVVVVTATPLPAPPPPQTVFVPVPVPAPVGQAPQYLVDAINEANNAYIVAKWTLDPNDLLGHLMGQELSDGQDEVRGLIHNRTRVASHLDSGYLTSWSLVSPTRVTATTNENWHFVNYDADRYTLERDTGTRLYRNIYTIDFVSGVGWRVSLDSVPNPNGEATL